MDTHVVGIIRFDSLLKNTTPSPAGLPDFLSAQMHIVKQKFRAFAPTGAEGSLEIDAVLTNRGPTLIITGDLRDYGVEDMEDFESWLNTTMQDTLKELQNQMTIKRDSVIRVHVETEDYVRLYLWSDKYDQFVLAPVQNTELYET